MKAVPRQRWLVLAVAVAVACASCSRAKSKDRLCIPSYALCDGDVWVHCPGGWFGVGSFNLTPKRHNCRDERKRCVEPRLTGGSSWVGCMEPLGTCQSATFKTYCQRWDPGNSGGAMVLCVRGEKLAIGQSCEMQKTAPP